MTPMFMPSDCTIMLVDENKNSLGSVDFRADQVKVDNGSLQLPPFTLTAGHTGNASALVIFYGPLVMVCEIGYGANGEIHMNNTRILSSDTITFDATTVWFDTPRKVSQPVEPALIPSTFGQQLTQAFLRMRGAA